MKVVHIVRQFHPSIGGLEDFVLNLARRQRLEGPINASVVTLNTVFTDPNRVLPDRDEVMGVPVTRVRWRGSRRYPIAPAVLQHVTNADLVHVHAIDFFFDFLAATRRLHRKPLVATVHGGFFHTGFLRPLKQVFFQTVTRASALAYDRIVGNSDNDTALFSSISPRKKLVTIENGVDTTKFADCSSERYTRRIVYFGRLTSHKRITTLFPLLAALRRTGPDWELTVAGAPAEQSIADLANAASAAGVQEWVRFVQSPTDGELREIFRSASYFACASAYEGFGMAAVEAMSAGLVPMLSNIPPFTKLIGKAGVGVLFEPTDPVSAAAAVTAFEQQAANELQAVRSKLKALAARYDWDLAVSDYTRVYQDALSAGSRVLSSASSLRAYR